MDFVVRPHLLGRRGPSTGTTSGHDQHGHAVGDGEIVVGGTRGEPRSGQSGRFHALGEGHDLADRRSLLERIAGEGDQPQLALHES